MTSLTPLTPLGELPGIKYGFFGKEGGVSEGIYGQLNCRLSSSDNPENIKENRTRVAEHLGTSVGKLLTVRQFHSDKSVLATNPWPIADNQSGTPEADALVTTTPGLAIGSLTADCGPVLFADPVNRVIGAAHAGWRGAVGGILESTLDLMEKNGAKKQHIHASLGPTISAANYEVGHKFQQDLCKIDGKNSEFFHIPSASGKPHFDLPAYIMQRLSNAGISNLANAGVCTYANESNYYSYRYGQHQGQTDYGCQIASIMLV